MVDLANAIYQTFVKPISFGPILLSFPEYEILGLFRALYQISFDQIHGRTKKFTRVSQTMTKFLVNNL